MIFDVPAAGVYSSLYVFPSLSLLSAASCTEPESEYASPPVPDLFTRNLGSVALSLPSVTFTVTLNFVFGSPLALSVSRFAEGFVVTQSGLPLTVASGAGPVTCT